MAAARIEETLHPESLTVFLRDAESGRYVSVFPPDDGSQLSAEAPIVVELRRAHRGHETETAGLALPIVAKQDLLGRGRPTRPATTSQRATSFGTSLCDVRGHSN